MYGDNAGPPMAISIHTVRYVGRHVCFKIASVLDNRYGMVVIGSVIHNRRYVCFIIASMRMIHNRWYGECDS